MNRFKDITTGSYISLNSNFDKEHAEWLVVPCTLKRDSDCADESNHHAALKYLGGESDTCITVEHSHWACGWVRFIIVSPEREPEVSAIATDLDMYPLLDEDDHTEREMNAANEVWERCYNEKERIAYIRKHSSQFEFHSMADLMGCVRGKYFAGYASELLG